LHVLDTPGINEVEGNVREKIAREAAQRADLILFVTEGDLNDTEYRAICDLLSHKKALVLALNKTDILRAKDRTELLESIRKRVQPMISPDLVVPAMANPRPVEVLIESTGEYEERPRQPDVSHVVDAIFEVLDRDGLTIVALNALQHAAEASDKIAAKKVELRRAFAEALIFKRSMAKAFIVAGNPIPLVDVAGGIGVDVEMVWRLAKVFGIDVTMRNASELASQIAGSAFVIFGTEAAIQGLLTSAKVVPLVGHALVAVPQATFAYMFSQIVGNTAVRYYERGASWGPRGPKVVVERVVAEVVKDKKTYLRNAAQLIKGELQQK